jgi:hypothetical protein
MTDSAQKWKFVIFAMIQELSHKMATRFVLVAIASMKSNYIPNKNERLPDIQMHHLSEVAHP